MFWRSSSSQQPQGSPPPPSQHVGDDGYDQYVWEEDEETRSIVNAVRFNESPEMESIGSEDGIGEDPEGLDDEEGRNSHRRPSGSPFSFLFNRFGHEEGSQQLLSGSRRSLQKIHPKNSRNSMKAESSGGSLASMGGSPRPSSRGSPTVPRPASRSSTLRARSPQAKSLLRTDAIGPNSQQRLEHLQVPSSEGFAPVQRSGSVPGRLGDTSSKPSNAAIAAAHQADRMRGRAWEGGGTRVDERSGAWHAVSVGGTKRLMRGDGSQVMIGIGSGESRSHLPSFNDVGHFKEDLEGGEEEDEEGSAVNALVTFGYYLVMPALSLFHCSHRILRSYPVRVLSSVILLAGLALCVILAAVHLPIRLNKQKNVRGEPLTFSPPEGHIGPMLGAAEGGLYRNLFAEMLHKSDAEVEKKLQDTWRFLFEGNVSTEAIYVPVGETPEGDKLGYVLNTESGWVTSEAMSYGMMVAVQYDRRETFDALWSWASRYMRHVTGRYKGFFAWKCSLAGRKLDGTPAPDAEEWIATALIFANNRWMSQGRYDYEKEAVALLLDMGDPRRGMFTKHGEVTLNPVRPVITNPSYHLPHFYEVWARFLNDRGQYQLASFYLQAAERSRRLLHKAVDQHTGLSADYTDYEGVGVKDLAGHSNFQWDAWRVVANVAVDWSWWRRDAWQQREADTLQAFLIRQGIQDYPSTYALNGTALLKSHSVGLVAVNAVASLAATDRNVASAFVAELWNAAIPRNQWRYYNGMLVFLSLLQVSGRYRSLY